MSHSAFYLLDVIPSTGQERVSCISYFDDSIYLGTTNGKLLHYRTESRMTSSGQLEYTSNRVHTIDVASSKYSVDKVEVLPDLQTIIVQCNGALISYRMESLEKTTTVLDSKNVVTFSMNLKSNSIAVVTSKKRVRLYEWSDGKFVPLKVNHTFDIPDIPSSVLYCGTRIFLGFLSGYVMINENTGDSRNILGAVPKDTRPILKHLPNDNILVTCTDFVGVVLQSNGDPAAGHSVMQFSQPSGNLLYSFPYILSVSSGIPYIEVHPSRSSKDEIIQKIPLPSECVSVTDGRSSSGAVVNTDREDSASRGRNPIFIALTNRVMRLQPVPVDKQVTEMLRTFAISSSLDLIAQTCVDPIDLRSRLARAHLDVGRTLLYSLMFEQAFVFLTASAIDPREILQLFPDLLPGSTVSLLYSGGPTSQTRRIGNSGGPPSLGARQDDEKTLDDLIGTSTAPSTNLVGQIKRSSDNLFFGSDEVRDSVYMPYDSVYITVSSTQAIISGQTTPFVADFSSAAPTASQSGLSLTTVHATPVPFTGLPSDGAFAQTVPLNGFSSTSSTSGTMGVAACLQPCAPPAVPGRLVQLPLGAVDAVVHAQHAHYIERMRLAMDNSPSSSVRVSTDVLIGEERLGSHCYDARVRSPQERLVAAYSHLLPFLRSRRKAVAHALRARGNALQLSHSSNQDQVSGRMRGSPSEGKVDFTAPVFSTDLKRNVPFLVSIKKGSPRRFHSTFSAFSMLLGSTTSTAASKVSNPFASSSISPVSDSSSYLSSYSTLELEHLLELLDIAVMKCLAHLQRYAMLAAFLSRPNRVPQSEAQLFLSHQCLYSHLGLYFLSRGNDTAALRVWRAVGTGEVVVRNLAGVSSASDILHFQLGQYSSLQSLLSTVDQERKLFAAIIARHIAVGVVPAPPGLQSPVAESDDEESVDSISDYEDIVTQCVEVSAPQLYSQRLKQKLRTREHRLLDGVEQSTPITATGALMPFVSALKHRHSPCTDQASAVAASRLFDSYIQANYLLPNAAHNAQKSVTQEPSLNPNTPPPGLMETVDILQASSDTNTIFAYASWVLLTASKISFSVLCAPPHIRLHALPPELVLSYLRQLAASVSTSGHQSSTTPNNLSISPTGILSSSAGVSSTVDYVTRQYLEVLCRSGQAGPDALSLLAQEYAKVSLHLIGSFSANAKGSPTASRPNSVSSPLSPVLLNAVGDSMVSMYATGEGFSSTHTRSKSHAGSSSPKKLPGDEGGLLGEARSKLIALLQETQLNDYRPIYTMLDGSRLLEELVIVCYRMGAHAAALSLLVSQLVDIDAAVRYCVLVKSKKKNFSTDGNNPNFQNADPFLILLSYIKSLHDGFVSSPDASDALAIFESTYGPRLKHTKKPRSTNNNVLNKGKAKKSIGNPFGDAVEPDGDLTDGDINGADDVMKPSRMGDSSVKTISKIETSPYLGLFIQIVEKHTDMIDIPAAFSLLPDNIPLQRVLGLCEAVLPTASARAHSVKVERALYSFSSIDAYASLVSTLRKPLVLTKTSTCEVCGERVTVGMIVRTPSGGVLHYFCSSQNVSSTQNSSTGSTSGVGNYNLAGSRNGASIPFSLAISESSARHSALKALNIANNKAILMDFYEQRMNAEFPLFTVNPQPPLFEPALHSLPSAKIMRSKMSESLKQLTVLPATDLIIKETVLPKRN